MASDKELRTKVEELTETVRELRDEVTLLRGAQPGHSCHGHHCGCWHYHYTPTWNPCYPGYPYGVTYGTTITTAGIGSGTSYYVGDNAGGGGNGGGGNYTVTN